MLREFAGSLYLHLPREHLGFANIVTLPLLVLDVRTFPDNHKMKLEHCMHMHAGYI